MKVRCYLRRLRGVRSLRDMAGDTKIDRGTLSQIERGLRFATDAQAPAIERVYGAPRRDWYPRELLVELERDNDVRRLGRHGSP